MRVTLAGVVHGMHGWLRCAAGFFSRQYHGGCAYLHCFVKPHHKLVPCCSQGLQAHQEWVQQLAQLHMLECRPACAAERQHNIASAHHTAKAAASSFMWLMQRLHVTLHASCSACMWLSTSQTQAPHQGTAPETCTYCSNRTSRHPHGCQNAKAEPMQASHMKACQPLTCWPCQLVPAWQSFQQHAWCRLAAAANSPPWQSPAARAAALYASAPTCVSSRGLNRRGPEFSCAWMGTATSLQAGAADTTGRSSTMD